MSYYSLLGIPEDADADTIRTAFVPRPHEYGPAGKPDLQPDSAVDLPATDFNDLARQLGA